MLATLMWTSPGLLTDTSSRTAPVWGRFRNGAFSVVFPEGCACAEPIRQPSEEHRHHGAHPGARLTSTVTWCTSVTSPSASLRPGHRESRRDLREA